MRPINHNMKIHYFATLFPVLILSLVSKSCQITYEDEDTIVIEEGETRASEGARWTFARQFPGFGQGWPLGIGSNGFPQLPNLIRPGQTPGQRPGQCMTRSGYAGECRQATQCFPSLYNPAAYTVEERSADLMEFYQTSGCGHPVLSNHLYFTADAETRQSMVCCNKKPGNQWPSFGQFPTRKPVTQFPAFTRPTTQYPSINRNLTMFPQIIGGPGGHRPPTPKPAGGPRPPAIAATTQRPWPPATTTTARPWPPRTTTTTTMKPWWETTMSTRPTTIATTPPPTVSQGACGVSRIVGGTTPARGSYPWMVSILWNNRHDCGGSLIDNRHILTAAHCTDKYTHLSGLTILLGAHNRGAPEEGRITRRVIRMMKHRQFYGRHPIRNDIAMMTLDTPVDLGPRNPTIKAVCLPPGKLNYDTGRKSGWVSGWGGRALNSPPVLELLHVKLRILTNNECAQKYQQMGHQGIYPTVFCAANPGQDSCQGDSGGPFIIKDSDTGPATQIGIVSWGIGCGTGPGVYTRVDEYLPWIEKNRSIR